jgi:soluble lytic murein transglycosylase
MITKQQQRVRRDRCATIAVLMGIVLLIFSLGTVFGVHLSIKHTQTGSDQSYTQSAAALTVPVTVRMVNEQSVTDSEAECSNLIVSDGNALSYELQTLLKNACEKYNVPYALALAVAEKESSFNPDAVSKTDDYGLMQINKINFAWLSEQGIDPLTYEGNIEAGVLILAQKLEKYGDTELALMAYHFGDTGAKKLWDTGTYSTDYSNTTMVLYQKWLNLLEDL